MFSTVKLLDQNTFFTLLLRVLGYDDRKDDFSYDDAWSKAYEIGLISDSTYNGFEEDSMALVCYFVLLTEMKGTEKSLAEELVSKGVIDRNTAAGIGVVEYQE
jgi:hypothetical protein